MKPVLRVTLFMALLFIRVAAADAQLNRGNPEILDHVGVDEKLGEQIPGDITFTGPDGESVTLAELLESGKPVLLNPLYYDCPILCSTVLEGVFNAMRELRWTPGEEFTMISFSIDPEEPWTLAAENRQRYLDALGREQAWEGWHFLTADEEQIRRLTDAIGWSYIKEERTGEYIHPASIVFLSPEGVITRYLYGAEFKEFDIRNALDESAEGRIGTTVDQVMLYCFTYDPASDSYVPVAMNIMKLGGFATLIFLGIFLGVFWYRERRKSSQS